MRSAKALIKCVGDPDSKAWAETLQFEDSEKPKDGWTRMLVDFNRTRKPGEKARVMVKLVRHWRVK